ncbi:hypothetical protein WKH27_22850 [Pantoea agglomerans]|uniref:Uncharacterized protein n=1 Tax=Enterobacter agglomerans TaxID=549 RepID=A0A7X2MIG0_ENTAG|nr:hypothetical protein [Pantoea agglomerans]MSE13842.1 hypothetical protein [Pantoea agglomerans]WNK56271.1 hypothetical protein RM154_23435 [Pantoea agglomerans]
MRHSFFKRIIKNNKLLVSLTIIVLTFNMVTLFWLRHSGYLTWESLNWSVLRVIALVSALMAALNLYLLLKRDELSFVYLLPASVPWLMAMFWYVCKSVWYWSLPSSPVQYLIFGALGSFFFTLAVVAAMANQHESMDKRI